MRLPRIAGFAAALAACTLAAACGGGEHSERHAVEKATPAPAPPTPDTTPIEPLRTPAGLVLKINEPTTVPPAMTPAVSPAASAAPSPAATPAPASTATKAG